MKLLNLFSFFAVMIGLAGNKQPVTVISCAAGTLSPKRTITSVRSGRWSDPATWGGRIPKNTDAPVISAGNTVWADVNTTVTGLQVAGSLVFDSSRSVTLQSSKNILVTGLLQMHTGNSSAIHTIRFINVNENNFEGGGMDVLASDIGLWVMESGRLDWQGKEKTSWTNATGAIAAGATSIVVKDATGWHSGDEIMITPTSAGDNNFDVKTIASVKGNTVVINSPATGHPVINGLWTAEVGNLTRTIHIEGTASGKSHVFIRSSSPQIIKNVSFRYLGPRKDQGGSPAKELVQGRYGLHFHHCMDGSVGSVVNGCVMRDIDNHAYVPHYSNGIVMSDNIAFNTTESPFWWDIADPSHNIQWLHNLVALPKYVERALGFDTKGAPTLGVNGFVLGFGDDNVCNNNVVAAQTGLETINAAFDWEEMGNNESEWTFKNNLAHNCSSGLRSWQNSTVVHVIENTTLYNNEVGIFHGAYLNLYRYTGGTIYKSVIHVRAASGGGNRLRFEDLNINAAGLDYAVILDEGPLNGPVPILFRGCTISGARKAQVIDQNPGPGKKNAEFVECHVATPDYKIASEALPDETFYIQPPSGPSYRITKTGKTNVPAFAPRVWNDGTGLQVAYYSGRFDSLLFKRIEPNVNQPEFTNVLFHHKLPNNKYSIRYTGEVMPQYNADYTFYAEAGGGVRLWVNDSLIIDHWYEQYPGLITSEKIKLRTSQHYTIRLDYFNEDDRSGINLYWSCDSLPRQYVPQSQLYY